MPSSPFIVYGVIYNSSGNNTSKSQITFSTDVNSKITISDSKGRYLIDLADIEYSDGGTIYYVAYDEFRNETNSGSFTVSGGIKELKMYCSKVTEFYCYPSIDSRVGSKKCPEGWKEIFDVIPKINEVKSARQYSCNTKECVPI